MAASAEAEFVADPGRTVVENRQLYISRECRARIKASTMALDAGADEVVRVAGASVVNLNCLPDEIDCFIFAEPPLIVAYAKGFDLTPTRERVQQPSVAPKPVERPHHTPRYRMKI